MMKKKLADYMVAISFLLFAALCGLSFGHSDLLVTAQRSLLYLEGSWKTIWTNIWDNFAHFYTNSYQLAGDYGANYLPSTFLLFAIWNIPYKLFANASFAWGEWSVGFQIWNKLLPILFYVVTCITFRNICRNILHLDAKESRWGMLAYAVSPIAFFCQFIFCQYDIFTVFFMVLGLYYYFKKDRTQGDFRKFILFMGISSTFKYFTLVIMAVLLILENKNVIKCIGNFLLGCMPIFIEGGFYLLTDRDNFTASVIGFKVLKFAEKAGISVGFAQIKLLPLAICIILVLAYQTHITDYLQRLQYGIFFCVCICAALFGLMNWHPQWILFAIPFWTLALIANKNKSFLITLDIAFSVCYIGYVVSKFTNNVDQNLLKYGIFTNIFRYRTNIPVEECMGKYFPLDTDLMFTAMVAIMVAYCVLSHPKNQREDADMPALTDHIYGIMVRFAIGVLVFLVPAGLCVPKLLERSELLWKSWSVGQDKIYATNFLTEEDENTVQYIQGVEGTASEVYAYTVCPYGKVEGLQVSLSIIDVATGNCEGYSVVDADNIGNNEMTIFSLQDTVLEPERLYEFIFNCNQDKMVHMAYILESEYGRYTIDSVKRDHNGDVLAVDHVAYYGGTLYMQIEGRHK